MTKADRRQHFGCLGQCFVTLGTPNEQGHGDVFQRGKLSQQVMELVDETEVAIAPVAACHFAERRKIAAHQCHVAGRRNVQPAEQVEQRAFTGTGSAHNGDGFAWLNCQIDTRQHRYFQPCATKYLAQITGDQNGITHSAGPPPD